MKKILFYISVIFYLIRSLGYKLKLEKIRKKRNIKEAQEYLNEQVLQWATFIVKNKKIDLEVRGEKNLLDEPCLFVCNHQSNLDIPSLMCALNKSLGFAAKKEMDNIPIMTYWMKQIHCIFIDRSNPREGMKAIKEGINNLKDGHSMVIFPEGTRSKGREMGEFKKGSLRMALKSGVPIIPVTIDGTYKSLEVYDKKSKRFNVKVVIDKPIDVKNLSREEAADLTDKVRDIIESNF